MRKPKSLFLVASHLQFCTLAFALLAQTVHAQRAVIVAGGGDQTSGVATNCRLHAPFAIGFDRAGNMYIAEMAGGERVLKVDRQGMLTVFAGTGQKGEGGDGGPAAQARFNGMHSLAVGPADDLFIADTLNQRVRRIHTGTGMILPFAGTGKKGFSGDGGPAVAAQFGGLYCAAFDARRERLYLADLDNRRIRAVDLKSGLVTTVAGNGQKGVPADGAKASRAPLVDPRAVAVDSEGNLYILERSGHALRKVDRSGNIRTVAGTGGKGFAGDGGAALRASFNEPKHICIDANDNVIIADTDNHVIRKYLVNESRVVHVAGRGKTPPGSADGISDDVELNQPHGVCVDKSNTLYIADSLNNRVLRIDSHP